MMADVSALFELVQLITDFLPIAIVVAVVLFLIGMIFLMIPSRGKIAGALRIDKKMIVAMLGLMTLLLTSVSMAHGAVAMTVDSSVSFGGTVETLKITGLTSASEYTVWATGNSDTFTNVTFVASAATEFIPVPVIDDADGYTLSIGTSTAGVAASASTTLYRAPRDIGDFLPIDFFFNALVPLILILVVVGLLVGMRKSFSNRGN